MLTEEYMVMLLMGMDLVKISLYVVSIWFVQKKIRNLSPSFITPAKEKHKMENIAMRSLVVVLALVGFGATSVKSSAKTTNASVTKSAVLVQTNIIATPTPMCPPNQPNGCGID
jgi:hypothetical protein